MKKFLLVIGLLVLVIAIIPLFLSSKFSMSRSIEINAPVPIVFSKLTSLTEYVKWNPFPEGDLTNTETITGEGIGSYMTWKGQKTGEGKMTIKNIEQNKKIDIEMVFYKPMSGGGLVSWITNAKSDTTTEMIWTYDQDLTYFSRYFGLFMDSMLGKHYEKGLLNFKVLVENSNE